MADSVFPLKVIRPKIETEERTQFLADKDLRFYLTAEEMNLIFNALEELNQRSVFVKQGQPLILQSSANAAEGVATAGDWAIVVNADGNLVIGNYEGNDEDGNAVISEDRIFEKN